MPANKTSSDSGQTQSSSIFSMIEPQGDVSVRPFSSQRDYERMVDYFLSADDAFLSGMAVERRNLPGRDEWLRRLLPDLDRQDREKQTFFVAWLCRQEPIGHSNINSIAFGVEAYMHLHMWRPELRRAGLGSQLVTRSVELYFERFKLKKLVCEPWSQNVAPNRTLQKVGFQLVRTYRTIPGPLNLEIEVNRYELTPGDLQEWGAA